MSRLTAGERRAMPKSEFAGPGRSYPIPDKSHAVFAKEMAAKHASPEVRAKVDRLANAMLKKG